LPVNRALNGKHILPIETLNVIPLVLLMDVITLGLLWTGTGLVVNPCIGLCVVNVTMLKLLLDTQLKQAPPGLKLYPMYVPIKKALTPVKNGSTVDILTGNTV
jgi:hypothetical protein